jgi:hypothetical protein
MKMSSERPCPLAGCGKKAVASAPSHDPFANVVFEELARPTMSPTCDEHTDALWTLYRGRVALALLDGSRQRVSIAEEAIRGVAWTLNSHNDATSKSVAAWLATVGRGTS